MSGHGLFSPGNVGSYPGRVERARPGDGPLEILDLRETDDRGVSLVTVLLSLSRAGVGQDIFRAPYAELSWGVGSGRDRALFDWLHGQSITVPASFLRLSAYYPTNDRPNPEGWPQTLIDPAIFGAAVRGDDEAALWLGASVAPMPHPTQPFGASPRLTTYHIAPAGNEAFPGQSDLVPVPSHAQSVTVCHASDASIVLWTISSPTATSPLAAVTISNPNLDQCAVPVSRGVDYVVLNNPTGADISGVAPLDARPMTPLAFAGADVAARAITAGHERSSCRPAPK